MKYAVFIAKKTKDLPKFSEIFSDRTTEQHFLNLVETCQYEDCTLLCLQLLCDFLVHLIGKKGKVKYKQSKVKSTAKLINR